MENNYVVYLNKRNDVWAIDGHTWAKKNNIPVKEENIISEVLFYNFLDRGLLDGKAIYFCREIQDDRKAWEDKLINAY